jgi:hypothetical protein
VGKGETTAEPTAIRGPVRRGRFSAEVVAPLAGLVGAWTAAGSIGLIGHPLRHALTWVAIAIVVIAAWPRRWGLWHRTAVWFAGISLALVMAGFGLAPVNVMAVALSLAVTALVRPDAARSLRAVAAAAAVLAIYRLAITSIPALWLIADRIGGSLGRVAGWITGQPLHVGATFGGLDFLVAMMALFAIWIAAVPRPRWRAAAWGAVGIIAAQFSYLMILSAAPSMLDFLTRPLGAAPVVVSLPGEKAPPAALDERFSVWLAESVPWKDFLPWNVPVAAALLQACVAAALLTRSARARPIANHLSPPRPLLSAWCTATAALLAALLPVASVLAPYHATLEGKRVVAFEKGLLNWDKPVHGQYGRLMVGMYGMFGPFVESLGGSFSRSPDLSEQDLSRADLLVLFYPTHDFKAEQIRRVQKYIADGGKLLLMCDHTGREPEIADDRFDLEESRFNELLEPTSIRVGFDAAEFAVGGWLESYEAISHPTTLGIEDSRNLFGVVIGASLDIRSPAVPLLIGRWGYSDSGDEGAWPALLGNQRYDPGEKLGDLVLAAEQPWGKGRVMVFGDTSTLNNGIVIGSYPFASRLLAYMAGDGATARTALRQRAAVAMIAVLALLLCWRPTASREALVAVLLSASLATCTCVTSAATELKSDGRHWFTSNKLAYIDHAHLGAFSEESNRPDGLFGFEYALMRDDYLVLSLYDLTYERLSRAGVFASLGPQRAFSAAEREAIRRFVEEGGIFILTAGYERSAASRELLEDFQFTVGATPPGVLQDTEPAPLGHFKDPYYIVPGDYEASVRFRAAWPIHSDDPAAKKIAHGIADRSFDPVAGSFRMDGRIRVPVIIVRNVGKGKLVVIGDTEFATNKNLENEDGSPIEGLRENADFWRWLIPKLRGTTPWYPPKQEPVTPPMETKP